jgi:L-lactate permease
VPPRSKLYLLLVRAVIALLPVALLVLFFFSSRIAGWLPQSTALFVFTAVALSVWMSGIARQRGAAEREIYLRAVRRLAAWLRPK